MTTNPDDKKPKQVLATYAVIALIVMFLLNILFFRGSWNEASGKRPTVTF